MRHVAVCFVLAVLASLSTAPAQATDVDGWLPTAGAPRLDGTVRALATFDDGSGPALYVGGSFKIAGGIFDVDMARFDGSAWTALMSGAPTEIKALATWDGGTGPALYVGGLNVRSWNGSSWNGMGGGVDGHVHAFAVFDDGSGEALYVGGSFNTAGKQPIPKVARFDGFQWEPVGTGVLGSVLALTVFDDGSGPALYAGGSFSTAGGQPAAHIARWDGSSWSSVGGGMNGEVTALAAHDDGNGRRLFAGGSFSTAGGVSCSRIAAWDGLAWADVGGGVGNKVATLFSDGERLLAGGAFLTAGGLPASRIAAWDGTSWDPLAGGLGGPSLDVLAYSFARIDAGSGSRLFVGGSFGSVGGNAARGVASWDGTQWTGVPAGLDGAVRAFATHDDGRGEALFLAGRFTAAQDELVSHVARWDGADFSPLDSGTNGVVSALAALNDGGGADLYVGGWFTSAGGVPAVNVARWDGAAFSAAGVLPRVETLATFDNGLFGEALVAIEGDPIGGNFANLHRWTGVGWSALATFTWLQSWPCRVDALLGFDGKLFAGGRFELVSGFPTKDFAFLGALGWNVPPDGSPSPIIAFAVHDDGSGPALYAGCSPGLRKWTGSGWTTIVADATVTSLLSYDGGDGPVLYASGPFSSIGGVPAAHIARRVGTSWEPLGDGIPDGSIDALAVLDDGSGPVLHVGGTFTTSPAGDAFFARWRIPRTWTDLGGGAPGIAGVPQLTMSGPLTPSSTMQLDLVDGAPGSLAVVFLALDSIPAPFLGGTLHSNPFANLFLLATDGAGELHGATSFPGAPSGQGLWLQVGIVDASVPVFGASLSNGVVGVTP